MSTEVHRKQPTEFDPENPFCIGAQTDEVQLQFDNGKSLYVSKIFLSYASPVFERMFHLLFRESKTNTVKMKEKEYDAFLDFLLFLHPRIQKKITEKNAQTIYGFGDEYEVPTVVEACENVLKEKIMKISFYHQIFSFDMMEEGRLDELFDMLLFSEMYRNEVLANHVIERLSTIPSVKFMEHPCYDGLRYEIKNKLLTYRLSRCEKDQVFNERLSLS